MEKELPMALLDAIDCIEIDNPPFTRWMVYFALWNNQRWTIRMIVEDDFEIHECIATVNLEGLVEYKLVGKPPEYIMEEFNKEIE